MLTSALSRKRGREIEIKLIARLRRHLGNPKFTELGERLERIKECHEQGLLTSVEFLKQMLELAQDTLQAERRADPVEERNRAKEALTELFKEAVKERREGEGNRRRGSPEHTRIHVCESVLQRSGWIRVRRYGRLESLRYFSALFARSGSFFVSFVHFVV